MNKKRYKAILVATLMLFAVFFSNSTLASEFNFAVIPNIPNNQRDKSKT